MPRRNSDPPEKARTGRQSSGNRLKKPPPGRQRRLLDLLGELEWDKGFDYKAERSRD